jgi:hypothetical protein
MAKRGDLTVLHEPFGNLRNYGDTDVDGQTFDSPAALLAWLREAQGSSVFLKDTMDNQYDDVLADRRFLAEFAHSFLFGVPGVYAPISDVPGRFSCQDTPKRSFTQPNLALKSYEPSGISSCPCSASLP